MTGRGIQSKAAFMNQSTAVVVVVLASLMTCCNAVKGTDAAASDAAASGAAASGGSVISYQSQTDLFPVGQRSIPFLIEHSEPSKANPPVSESAEPETRPFLSLMSLSSPAVQAVADSEGSQGEPPVPAKELQAVNQPSIADLADTLQWTILLLSAVVAGVIGVHRMAKHKQKPKFSERMEYQGCLPIRGQFSMHLVTIANRQFLVTTDRSGVKNVNSLNDWDQFSTPVDPTADDQFPAPSMELEPGHHG